MRRTLLTFALLIGVVHFQSSVFNVQCLIGGIAAQTNELSIGDVTFPAGKTAVIPIELNNQSDICGVQFEIGLPYQLSTVTDEETGGSKLPFYLNRSRTNGFDMSVRSMGNTNMYYNDGANREYKYVYRVIITNVDNSPIVGSSGTLLTISMPLPETLANGAQLVSALRDNKIILSDREGNQVATSTTGTTGTVTVEVIPRPDLVPTNVTVSQTLANPGDQLDFAWKVVNQGDSATGAGWTEKLYLENENRTRVYVGTTAYEGTLEAGANVSRQFSVNLDEYPGISGNCRPVVQIVPAANCNEIPLNQANNTAYGSGYSLRVQKYLVLTPYKNLIPEKSSSYFRCELRRTGDLSEAQTFSVTTRDASGNTGRLRVGSDGSGQVKFTAQSNKTYIDLYPIDNEDINVDQRVAIVVNEPLNNGYSCVIDSVRVEDNDLVPLTLTLDKSEYNEGDVMHVTATVPERYYPEDLYVYLTIEQSKRFKLPQRIAFEAGATTATIDIPVVQDKTPANPQTIKLTGTADHHQKAEILFILNDDDTPAIEMTLTPTTVSEGSGPSAMLGTITRTEVTNNQITIKLTDDGTNDIYYSTRQVTMPAGAITATFPLGVKDNALVDGDRVVNVTAAIYISDCNCESIGDKQTSVTIPVTITDDDGPALSVTTNKATIMEGDATGATLTIKRNTTDNSQPLTVTIEHDGTDVTCPTTVTIPAGSASTTISFVALSNTQEEGDRTVSITAKANGYSMGSAWLLISDRTLPDLALTNVEVSTLSPNAGQQVTFTVTLENIGAAAMHAGTFIKVKQNSTEVSSLSIPENIGIGESKTYTLTASMPNVPGSYIYNVILNEDKRYAELVYVNNNSESFNVSVKSLYTFTITSNKNTYNEQEIVTLSGQVTSVGSSSIANLHIEPYVMFHGYRTKLDCLTDENGSFSVIYELPKGYRGHFDYGVCNPGEGLKTSMGEFNVYGFEKKGEGYLKHELYKGEQYAGIITLHNMTELALHNIHPTLTGATDNYEVEIGSISELPGDGTASITYTITGKEASTGNNWEVITVELTCDEGASLNVPFYNYTRLHKPKLVASTTNIKTTVTKGVSRTYPIILTNTGLAETGTVTITTPSSMASFISLATPITLPSMQPGDSTTVMLRFTPGNDLDVNLYQKGRIAINCEDGDGVAVDFNVKVVSESKGALRVQVRDENTIYGNKDGQKPYVKGATVQLKDYNTGAIVVQGTTLDETEAGILFENINEGYYQLYVTADKHDSYRQNIMVNPGDTTIHLATISYQAVSITWDVVETEVEDEYEIVTNVQYETQVPVPVVRMTCPDSLWLDEIEYGKATMYNIVLRNDGLIAALETQITLPSVPGFTFTPLVQHEGFTLGAGQSYTIPVRVTRNEPASSNVKGKFRASEGSIPCKGRLDEKHKWICGEDGKWACLSKLIDMAKEIKCTEKKGVSWQAETYDVEGIGGPGGGPGGGGGVTIREGGEVIAAGIIKLLCFLCECLCPDEPSLPEPPCTDLAKGLAKKDPKWSEVASCLDDLGVPMPPCLPEMLAVDEEVKGEMGKRRSPNPQHDLMKRVAQLSVPYYIYLNIPRDFAIERTGSPSFVDSVDVSYYTNLELIDTKLEQMYEDGTLYGFDPQTIPDFLPENSEATSTGEQLTKLMPNSIANWYDFRLRDYVERRQNTYRIMDGLEPTNENYVSSGKIAELQERADSCNQVLVDLGFISWEELLVAINAARLEYFEGASSNTCATVKLEIEQKLVLTRQAFRGTLTVDNATTNNLTNIELEVIVQNLLGEQATSHEFQINFESITGFEGTTEGPWRLGPNAKGVATVLFIPTKYAAPDSLTTYSFGGNLSWNDGDTYQTRALYPVSLQVKPSPELDLTYFMQRDIYGDNPLTEEVEPIIPAEFTVLIHNKGKGEATNVRMMTKQPKIVENEKGLAVDFAIVSSSLNGGEKAMALDSLIATQFGDIPAGGSSYATWDLTCTLLGHFTSYDVSVTHVTSYGNPDLSLLDQVTIHELIHSVNARFGEQKYRAWVCNDVEDGHAEPDHIYFSNGEDEDLKTLSSITTITALGDSKWRVRVTVPQKEWFYTAVSDPTGGSSKILSIKDENTGEDIDPENFWTTQWTMQDGFDPVAENKLHIVDYASGPKTFSYIIEFEPTPDLRLDVTSIETVPDEKDIAETVIDQLTVTFNKPIEVTTFNRDDIVLRYEGEKQNTAIPITMVENDSIFRLNTSALSENGYYILQVKTDSIMDKEGFLGFNGKQVKWMLFKDGLVHYNVSPWPEDAGTIQTSTGASSGDQEYGNNVTMTATANEGYNFDYWALNPSGNGGTSGVKGKRFAKATGASINVDELERISTDPSITVELNKTYNLVAVFKPKTYMVNVVMPTAVGEVNIGSGIYEYGTVLNLKATANEGYRIIGFVVDEEEIEGDEYDHTVTGDATIVIDYKDLSPVSVILQDTKDYIPEAIELANVKLQRSFRKGSWNTICLPCDVNNPGEVFGTGTKVARLTSMEGELMHFSLVNQMKANIPYLIKPGILMSNSLVANGETKTSLFDILGTSIEEPEGDRPIDTIEEGVSFIGSYVVESVPKDAGYYYISSDLLYYVDASANVPTGRFRGYFHADIEGLAKRVGVKIEDEIETIIVDVDENSNISNAIYSIDGKLVRPAGTSAKELRNLPKGIYIMNGHRVVIK